MEKVWIVVTYMLWLALLLGATGLIVWNLMRAPVLRRVARVEDGKWDRLTKRL